MSDDTIKIEVDGKLLEARKGQMLIEITDRNDIYVPRFCYHNKLSVAANCRMCLVDVEKAPKPLPACATPVMDGMVVRTKSELALEAQKSVMEFLLINHPLDCPICDQGGECELQDLAMGYGSDVSRYQETKRVVKDKNIGPLVQTDLTRCIHCTRCVRFGEEIAGLRELGATGRGEHMQIGTYIEKSMQSELSGNIIDLCPVGALTSKPFLFSARAWEMQQYSGIAPHDCVGSNVEFHVRNDRVLRVVPAANDAVNEVWLSDRDRFSYEGLYSDDRLLQPMLKQGGRWENIAWSEAMQHAADGLNRIRQDRGADQIGALLSASVSCEEYYLMQKLLRGLGSDNIDHRLRQTDFTNQAGEGPFPWLGQAITGLEQQNAVLVVGSNPRQDVPLINHRIRKAWLRGGKIMSLNDRDHAFNFDLAHNLICPAPAMARYLASILKAAYATLGRQADDDIRSLLNNVATEDVHRDIADTLGKSAKGSILLGEHVEAHPERHVIRGLALKLAELTGASAGFLSSGANSAGACLSGALPHRAPFNRPASRIGMHARSMIETPRAAYLLYHMEPEHDCVDPEQALSALGSAEFIVVFSAYRTESLESIADLLLPIALFAENEGSFVNIEGRVQGFAQSVLPAAGIRRGWRVLRKLGNQLNLSGFEYNSVADIQAELRPGFESVTPGHGNVNRFEHGSPDTSGMNTAESVRHMYRIDPLVRRGEALAEAGLEV
ncbi:MAG: NADH-quinone oxidoreductase subunit NuoG [Thiotrichales bacterium]|nr:NADH-quinone oxidoreductase subunit NuoG [Thiotrichales bacterium]